MEKKKYHAPLGDIYYWINIKDVSKVTLVFLPGLTATHRLFEKQIEYFEENYNVFVWDAPGHGLSWPFEFKFDLFDKAKCLKEIMEIEKIHFPVIIGQSMGGYVGQTFSELYSSTLKGFISIDSAPLKRKYVSSLEIWLLKRMEKVYYYYPWKWLLSSGTKGVSTTTYGRKLMHEIMMEYDGDKKRYAKLSGHGMEMLAKGYELDLNYQLLCPALFICGTKDQAGSTIRYNKMWHKQTKIEIEWIGGAGHNSNTDKPKHVNELIERFVLDKVYPLI